MRISLQIAASLLVAIVATTAAAQEPPSQYERVKQLEPYIGFWQGDFQPPDGPEGTLTGFSRWTSNRSYVQFQWSFQAKDAEQQRPTPMVTVIMGWDGKSQHLTSWFFSPESQGVGEVSMTNDGLVINETGTSVEGEPTSSKATYKLEGDQLTVTVSDIKVGDQSRPGYSFTVTKRERPRRRGQ